VKEKNAEKRKEMRKNNIKKVTDKSCIGNIESLCNQINYLNTQTQLKERRKQLGSN